jgi:hypothetical protein
MQQIGFSLIDSGGNELQYWGDSVGSFVNPGRVIWPNGDITEGVSGPVEYGEWKLVRRMCVRGPASVSFDGSDVVASIPITQAEVVRERDRRLALGFEYDFGDVRGVHRIGTTEADLKGWDEVSKYAGALIDIGDTTTQIVIATDTGQCTVTAPEWRAIEIASAEFRQPLWAKSFALMASNPIPADFTNDQHWT